MTKPQVVVPLHDRRPQPSAKVGRAKPPKGPYNRSIRGRTGQGAAGCGVLGIQQEDVTADPWADLIAGAGRGDRDAFAALYRETSGRLMAIAFRMLGRRDIAEEVLQEAFVSIWRRASQFDPARGRAFTWLAAIVRYRAIDRLRADGRERHDVELPEDGDGALPENLITDPRHHEPEAMAVRKCLAGLSEDQRRAITLAYYYGLTHEELADRLQAPLGTVKSWVRRGLLQLRTCLEQ